MRYEANSWGRRETNPKFSSLLTKVLELDLESERVVMKVKDKLDCLQREVDDLVGRFQSDCVRYKRDAFRLKIVSAILATIVTVLLGLKLQSMELIASFNNIALILSAAISVLSAYEAFFDPRALWVRETVTFARLKDLQRDLRFWASGQEPEGIDGDVLNVFKSKLDSILEETLKYWIRIRGAPDLEKRLGAAEMAVRAQTASA